MLVDPVSVNGQEKEQISKRRTRLYILLTETFLNVADGNPNTHALCASPEMVAASCHIWSLRFRPCK